jgi:small GTP-binding protein
MGNGGSTHTTQVVYRPDPATTAALTKATEELAAARQAAKDAGDPAKFKQNATKAMDTFVEKLPTLTLQQSIIKQTGETHVGVVGNTSAGKSTFLNALLGLKLPVSMDHCTEQCEVVCRRGRQVYWDVAGRNDQFEFYKVETLAFLKSLDVLIVFYCDDIGMITNIIRVAAALKSSKIILVRTKVDQFRANDARNLEEIKRRDERLASEHLPGARVYFISAHNIQDGGARFDWDALVKEIGV